MDLIFSFYDTVALQDSYRQDVTDILHRLGASRRPNRRDWYDLPPEPVFTRLPYDPDHDGIGLSPRLRALGTAQVGVRVCEFPPDLRVLVVAVQTTLNTSMAACRWRDFVASPGKAVIYRPDENYRLDKKVDWSRAGPDMAAVASTCQPSPNGLDLSLVCKRRTAQVRKRIGESDLDLVQLVDSSTVSATVGEHLYLSGSCVEVLDMPTTPELVDLMSEATANRRLLDILLERLRRISAEINHGYKRSRLAQVDAMTSWLNKVESGLHAVSASLGSYRHFQRAELSPAIDACLRISEDANHCREQLTQANHNLTSRLVLHTCTAVQDSIQSMSNNVESSIEALNGQMEREYADVNTRLASTASRSSMSLIYLAFGGTLLLIGGAIVLNVTVIGLIILGLSFMSLGVSGSSRLVRQGLRPSRSAVPDPDYGQG